MSPFDDLGTNYTNNWRRETADNYESVFEDALNRVYLRGVPQAANNKIPHAGRPVRNP